MEKITQHITINKIIDASNNGMCLIDNNGDVVYINQEGINILGYSHKSELINKSFCNCVLIKNNSECLFLKAQKDGRKYLDNITQFLTKDGNKVLVRLDVIPFKMEENLPNWVLISFEKITVDTLVISNYRYIAEMMEQAEVGFVITDLNGTIEYVNNGYSKISGYAKDELIGKTPRILKSGKHSPDFYKRLWSTITAGKVFKDTIINKRKDGEIFYEDVEIFPLIENNQIVKYAAIKTDVTKQKEIVEKLLDVEKFKLIGQIAGGVAHDFNNILTGFNGYIEVLRYSLKDENIIKILDRLTSLSDKGARLVSHLLGFARKQPVYLEKLKFSELIEEEYKMLRRIIPENIELEFENVSQEECFVNIDRAQFSQIIMNLAMNSKDALLSCKKDSKKIKIILNKTDANDYKHLKFIKQGNYMKLSVEDNGTGIKKEHLSKVFEPFFTTKDVGKGTGLGLANVYGIVKQNNGYIFAESVEGEFTRIDILWPCFSGDTLNNYNNDSVKHTTSHNDFDDGKNILFVEDNEDLLNVMSHFLEGLGFKVIRATDGRKGIEYLKKNKIHFLITDYILPGLNGDELIKKAMEIDKNIKFILTSGYFVDDKFTDFEKNHSLKFVKKPYSPAKIFYTLKELSNGPDEK